MQIACWTESVPICDNYVSSHDVISMLQQHDGTKASKRELQQEEPSITCWSDQPSSVVPHPWFHLDLCSKWGGDNTRDFRWPCKTQTMLATTSMGQDTPNRGGNRLGERLGRNSSPDSSANSPAPRLSEDSILGTSWEPSAGERWRERERERGRLKRSTEDKGGSFNSVMRLERVFQKKKRKPEGFRRRPEAEVDLRMEVVLLPPRRGAAGGFSGGEGVGSSVRGPARRDPAR